MDNNKKMSFVDAAARMKKEMVAQGMEFNNHIVFGVDVNENGEPTAVLSSLSAGGYTGLGMLDALQIMINETREQMEAGFIDIIKENNSKNTTQTPMNSNMSEGAKSALNKAAEFSLDMDKMMSEVNSEDDPIRKVLDEHKDELIPALLSKDKAKIAEVKKKIIEDIKKIKGDDFKAEFIFGLGDDIDHDGDNDNDKPDEGFNIGDISKYF